MKKSIILIGLGCIVLSVVLYSCKKKNDVPTLSTSAITQITATSASGGGNITSDGGADITSKGVCWGANANPTTSDSKTNEGKGTGQFVSSLTGLTAQSTYHTRAYAINSVGTAYGSDMSFTTLGQVPVAVTKSASNISATGSTLNGTVNANYLSTTVTFEYGTTASYGQSVTAVQNPVTGNAPADVTVEITGLTARTLYHFRVKTVNSLGTAYGSDMTFTTLGQLPAAVTQLACCLRTDGATLNGTVSANYLSTAVIFEYGTTTAYGHAVDAMPGTVTGNSSTNVSASLSGLNSGTLYHYRVKATNSLGTTTGADVTFTTSSSGIPALTTTSVTSKTTTSAVSGGNITSDGGNAITSRGVCWNKTGGPTINDSYTSDGAGTGTYTSNITGLTPGTLYFLRAYATNSSGTAYGNEASFETLPQSTSGQIIADHTIVDRFDDIPQSYIDMVKKMWFVVPGQSHSDGYRVGLTLLESLNPVYQVNVTISGDPEAYTASHMRASCATWGDYYDSHGWIYNYGEASWFTNATSIVRTETGITYCNTNNLEIAAFGFGWCWDALSGTASPGIDPIYGCHWYGESKYGPEGDKAWGIDAADFAETSNSVSMDTYLNATQQYADYCASQGYATKVFFTTGPIDTYKGESGYQGYLKYEHIRDYVKANTSRILFDYADILCYDDNGAQTTTSWNGHTYPVITATNSSPAEVFHISNAGAIRLAKASWWMLARIAGWDGK